MKDYKLINKIAEGSFALVWLAENNSGQQVVLKQYKSAQKAEARREFLFLSSLSNAHLPKPLAYFHQQEYTCLVQEYLSGDSLQDHHFTSESSRLKCFYELCNQIVTIQAAGICHNDLKPENIIIQDDVLPWLIDLGLATTNNFYDGTFRGSIAYSSPEKYKFKSLSYTSDIFALGMIYHFLFKGSHPADNLTNESWIDIISDQDKYNDWLQSCKLPDFVKNMLAFRAADRPDIIDTAQYFAELTSSNPDLRHLLIKDFTFNTQKNFTKTLIKQKTLSCHPDDEPQTVINRFVLEMESSGKAVFVISDHELINDPELLFKNLSSFTSTSIRELADLDELKSDAFAFLLIQYNANSVFWNLKKRPDTFFIKIDNSFSSAKIASNEITEYYKFVTSKKPSKSIAENLSIAAARLWVQGIVSPPQDFQPSPLFTLLCQINYPLPLALIELLEPDWFDLISAPLQKGYIKFVNSQLSAEYPLSSSLDNINFTKYQKIAHDNGFFLHSALIAILTGNINLAQIELARQYKSLRKKGFWASAWQTISLIEDKSGWESMEFELKKAKAFLTAKLGDPLSAISIYQKIKSNANPHQKAVIDADLAIAYQKTNQLDLATKAYLKALKYFKLHKDNKAILRCLNNLAAVYYQQYNYNQCKQIYLEIINVTEDKLDVVFYRNYHLVAKINLADLFLHQAEWKRSLLYARQGSQTADKFNLNAFKLQAEMIALIDLIALNEIDSTSGLTKKLLTEHILTENIDLYHSIAAQALFILQIDDPPQALVLAVKLFDNLDKINSEELILALFFCFWQFRAYSKIPPLITRISDPIHKSMIDCLTSGNNDEIIKTLNHLSRLDDVFLYIYFAQQLALANWHHSNPNIAGDLHSLLAMYSFAPLQSIIKPDTNQTPHHLQTLWNVVSLIHNNTEFDKIITAVLKGILQIIKLDRAVYFAYENGELSIQQALGANNDALNPESIMVSQSILLDTLERNEINFLSGLQDEIDLDIHSSIFGLGLRSAVCYPVRFGDSLKGVIYSDTKAEHSFDDNEQKLLTSLFFQARSALEKAFIIENMKQNQLNHLSFSNSDSDNAIIGNSSAMKKVFQLINLVADQNVNVLITGATGTGKELVAKALHQRYAADKPFSPVNCAAIPENLLESELFGYKKGAFTGANKDKKGLIETTKGGSLFLDEIADMPLSLQAKLLRVIQERKLTPLGSNNPIDIDIRLISATNIPLLEAVNAGKFRQDLYYRLKVIEINLPDLSQRPDDIPLLVQHFIKRNNSRFDKNIKGISQAAMQMLQNKTWMGNIRELENEIERAMVLCQSDEITLDLFETASLKKNYSLSDNIPLLWDEYKAYRRQFVQKLDDIYAKRLMKAADNKISAASKMADISRTQIYRLLKFYDKS